MGIYVLVVIAQRQLAKLLGKPMFASIVLAGRTPAVATPIPERLYNPFELQAVGINGATLAHRHVVGRIKTRSANIADRSGVFPFAVIKIARTQRVAVIFDQPQSMSITK